MKQLQKDKKKKWKTKSALLMAGILAVSASATVQIPKTIQAAEVVTLTPQRVAASSTQSDAYGTYVADYIWDGSLSTAWVEGVSGDGIGEFVDFFFPAGTYITGGTIYPAYYKSQDVFEKNGGVTKIQLQSGSEIREVDCSSAANSMVSGGYSFQLSDGIPCDGTLRVKIMGVRSGWKYQDTCISELTFVGSYGGQSSSGSSSGGETSDSTGNDSTVSGSSTASVEDVAGYMSGLATWAYKSEVSSQEMIETTLEPGSFSSDTKAFLLYWYQYQYGHVDSRIIHEDGDLYHMASGTTMKEIGAYLLGSFSDADFDAFRNKYIVRYDQQANLMTMNASGDFGDAGPLFFASGTPRVSNKGNARVDGEIKVYNSSAGGYVVAGYYSAYFTPSGDETLGGWTLTKIQTALDQSSLG